MTFDQVIAALMSILAGPDEAAFAELKAGGFDPEYPVTVVACPTPKPVLDVEGSTILCGIVDVPENHDAPDGNRIDISFAVLAARSLAPAPDAMVYLHGGPGGYAVADIEFNATNFDAFRERRDLVLFDQRASGISSQTVNCVGTRAARLFEAEEAALQADGETEDAAPDPFAALPDCLDEVAASGVVLGDYNTAQNARDVRALMSALGYEEYNAYGISYGTKLGQELMRSVPDGLRAVVLDSIAPVDNRSYDTNGVPLDQSVGAVVDLCAADPDCAEAFPDLEATFATAAERLSTEPIPASTTRPEIDLGTFIALFEGRNNYTIPRGVTAYIPLIASQFAAGNSQVYDLHVSGTLTPEVTPLSIISTYMDRVDQDLLAISYAAAQAAEGLEGQTGAIETLLRQVGTDTSTGPRFSKIESVLDRELSAAVSRMDPEAAIAMGRSYAALLSRPPSREAVSDWARANVPEPSLSRVIALIGAMSEPDIEVFYARAARDTEAQTPFAGMLFHTAIYACQESIPFNSREGFEAELASMRFPWLVDYVREDTASFYDICDVFTPVDAGGFHDPFDTDIPVLAMAGMNDTQTNPGAADHMAAMLSNATAVNFPDTGHGTIMFTDCAVDIAVSFIENPDAAVNDSCAADLTPDFVVP